MCTLVVRYGGRRKSFTPSDGWEAGWLTSLFIHSEQKRCITRSSREMLVTLTIIGPVIILHFRLTVTLETSICRISCDQFTLWTSGLREFLDANSIFSVRHKIGETCTFCLIACQVVSKVLSGWAGADRILLVTFAISGIEIRLPS